MKWLELYRNEVEEILENLDNGICSHKLGFKHFTEGGFCGNSYVGGDVWQVYCVRCYVIKEDYSVTYPDPVDWELIEKMKKHMNNFPYKRVRKPWWLR